MGRPATPPRLFPAQTDGREFLTAQEMSAVLKLNPQTLYRLARQGVIPAIRIGKKSLRFDPVQVRASLNAQGTLQARRRAGRLPAGRWVFTRLEDLRAQGRWPAPPPDLVLERFKVAFPVAVDLTALAYERPRP